MAKTDGPPRRYREDLSEAPDWLRKKKCPNRDKYLSGKRIQPKNRTTFNLGNLHCKLITNSE